MLALLVAQALQPKPIPPIDWNDLPYQETVRKMAQGWRAKYGLPGVWCAFVKDGRVVACVACGYKDIGSKISAGLTDYLNIGSVSKIITSSLLAEFISEGKITFETTLGETFPELKAKYPSSPILRATVRHLLSHRSGLSTEGFSIPRSDKALVGSQFRARLVELAVASKGLKEPGSAVLYTNVAANIVVAMVERVTGTNFESWLKGERAQRWGIASAKMHDVNHVNDSDVTPYYLNSAGSVRPGRIGDPGGNRWTTNDVAGGVTLTLEDFARFALSFLANRAQLSDTVYRQLVTFPSYGGPYTSGSWEGNPDNYLTKGGDTHSGEESRVRVSLGRKLGFVVFTNCGPDPNEATVDGWLTAKIDPDIRQLLGKVRP